MTGFDSKRRMAADKLQEPVLDLDGHVVGKVRKPQPVQEPWNEDEWRKNNWRCQHGWLRGEQCEICNASPAPQPAQRQWIELTPEDILTLLDEHNLYGSKLVELIRATESKLKEKNETT
jgi:hypothetical protein